MEVDVILAFGTEARTVERLAVQAEAYGLHGLWTQSFPAQRDPFMTIVPAALATRRIRLGVLPVSPYEHQPVKIADSLLTLNDLSRGRGAILVGGLGKAGMAAMGIRAERRVTAVRDCVRILKGVATGGPFEHRGEMYSAGPYRAPWADAAPPQVLVAANGPQMLRLAGELADGVMLSDCTEALMPETMAALDAGLAASGRTRAGFPVSNFWAWHVKPDREAAAREARRELVWRGALLRSHTGPFLSAADAEWVEQNFHRFLKAFVERTHVIEGVPEPIVAALVDGLTFTGDATDIPRIAARLREFERLGQTAIALRLFDDPEAGLRMIGEQLLPALQAKA